MSKSESIVFSKYTGSEESFVMPADVTEVAEGAFAKNKILKHIDLSNVRTVGAYAFQECTSLETVVMSNAAVIEKGAFEFCRSLRSVVFGSVTDIGESAFSFCAKLNIPEIPRSIKHVGAGAFSHTAIQRADLSWLEEIPPYLFNCCTSLTHADISGAKVIGDYSFEGCASLHDVKYGDTERIGARAFHGCESLKIASLPASLQAIGDDAFSCILHGLVIPGSVNEIGRNCLGPADRKKSIKIYESTLYAFRNYFRDDCKYPETEDIHSRMRESVIDITVLDNETKETVGFLPLYADLDSGLRSILTKAFKDDGTFDYLILDTDFFDGMSWNQRCKDRLAVMRLKQPFGLGESIRKDYTDYLNRHLKRIAQNAVRGRDIDMLAFLCENGMICYENITGILDYSISLPAPECTAFLLARQAEMDWHSAALIEEL